MAESDDDCALPAVSFELVVNAKSKTEKKKHISFDEIVKHKKMDNRPDIWERIENRHLLCNSQNNQEQVELLSRQLEQEFENTFFIMCDKMSRIPKPALFPSAETPFSIGNMNWEQGSFFEFSMYDDYVKQHCSKCDKEEASEICQWLLETENSDRKRAAFILKSIYNDAQMPYFLSPKQLIVLLENIGFNLPSITSLETFASKKNELIPIEKHYCKIDDNLTQLLDVVLHSIKSKVSEMSIDNVKLFLSVMLQMSLDYYLQSKMDLIVECIGFLLIFCPFEDLSSCIEELKLESVSQMSKILNTIRLVNPSYAQLLAKTQIAKLLDCNLAQLEEAIEEKIGKNDFLDNEAPKLYKFFTLFKVSLPLMDRGFLLRVMEPIQSIERNIQTMSSFIKSQAKNAALDVVTIIRLVNYDKITRKQSYLSEFFQNK